MQGSRQNDTQVVLKAESRSMELGLQDFSQLLRLDYIIRNAKKPKGGLRDELWL